MVVLDRPLKFEEIDAAGIAFFGCYATWAHDAMERFFDQLDGGYARLIVERRLGLPAVHFESEFYLPLRYGDVLRIETTVSKLGRRSAELSYRVKRAADGAGDFVQPLFADEYFGGFIKEPVLLNR